MFASWGSVCYSAVTRNVQDCVIPRGGALGNPGDVAAPLQPRPRETRASDWSWSRRKPSQVTSIMYW